MKTLKYLNYIFPPKQKVRMIGLFFIILIGTVMELLGVSLILPFINAIMQPDTILENTILKMIYNMFKMSNLEQMIVFLSMVLIVVYIVKNIYLSFMYDFQFKFIYDNQRELAVKLMSCYMKQNYLFHVANNSADLIRNLNTDVFMFFKAALAVLQLLTEVSVCIVLIVFLFISDVTITLGVIVILGLFFLFYYKFFKERITYYGHETRISNANVNKWMLQGFGGIKETKILEKEEFFIDKFSDAYLIMTEAQRKNQFYGILPKPVMEALCVSGILIVVVAKMSTGTDLKEIVPVLSVFAVAAFRMLPSFNKISLNLTSILYNKASVIAIYEDLKQLEDLNSPDKENTPKTETPEFNNKILIKNVSFTYPNSANEVLDNVTLEIPKNKSIAFVGPSGAGKTTIADMILGALKPTSGTIVYDQYDIFDNIQMWHKIIGYIPQNIYLMDDTLKNNIAYGIPEKDIKMDNLMQAIEDAQLGAFIEELENGIDTFIGEDGVRLSGGQRQRIGIARALYNNPEVLILDEATSALDNETESAVMDAINKLAGKKTLIIIAHRLSTIEHCDIVYEVKDKGISQVK